MLARYPQRPTSLVFWLGSAQIAQEPVPVLHMTCVVLGYGSMDETSEQTSKSRNDRGGGGRSLTVVEVFDSSPPL